MPMGGHWATTNLSYINPSTRWVFSVIRTRTPNTPTIRDRNHWAPTAALMSTRGVLATDHIILNHGQVTWTTPVLAPPSPNYHTTPTGGSVYVTLGAGVHVQMFRSSDRSNVKPLVVNCSPGVILDT
ncbi:hypothetical protein TNCV_1585711 [Trichonephila clavipes]|nr:hypothetical protein TNCV_1585711 [Trichonephila clavipes]